MKRFVVWAILSCMIIISCKKDSPEETYIHQTSFNSGNEILSSYAPMHATYFPENGEFVSNGGVEYKVFGPYLSVATGAPVFGNMVVEIAEFWTAKDMMCAGIPAVSDGYMLSSEGAFSILVKVAGEPVVPYMVRARIPDESEQFDMQMFYWDPEEEDSWFVMTEHSAGPSNLIEWTPSLGFPDSLTAGYEIYIGPWANWYDESGYLTVNCDEFFGQGLILTDLLIRPTSSFAFSPEIHVSMLFPSVNSVLDGAWSEVENGYVFQNIPIGIEAISFAVGVGSGTELIVGTINIEAEANGVNTLEMANMSEQQLEELLNSL